MRPSIRIAAAGFAFAVVSISCTWSAWAQAPVKTWNEVAHRDRETRVVVFYVYDTISPTLCRNFGRPPLTLIDPPQNGTVRIDETDFTPKGCPNPIKATGVFYRPNPGFAGKDRFTAEKGPQGRVDETAEGLHVFEVTVK